MKNTSKSDFYKFFDKSRNWIMQLNSDNMYKFEFYENIFNNLPTSAYVSTWSTF